MSSSKIKRQKPSKFTEAKAKNSVTKRGKGGYVMRTLSGQTYTFNDVTKVNPELSDFFCYSLNKAGHRMKARLETALAPLRLSAIHMGVFRLVEAYKDISQNELSEKMGLDKATMVKIVDHLQGLGVIERRQSPVDRRVNFILPTVKGRKLFAEALKLSNAAEGEFLTRLSADEIEILKRVLCQLIKD